MESSHIIKPMQYKAMKSKTMQSNAMQNNKTAIIMEQFKKQERLRPYFDGAYGYAFFPCIGKGGMGIGGAGGKGTVFINNHDGTETKVGESTVIQLSFGFQFGGQVYSEIIFLETQKDFENFTSGNFEFGADVNVVALTASASARASTLGNQELTAGIDADDISVGNEDSSYTKGMAVYTITRGGLMYQATISGQKFNYRPVAAAVADEW
mmetsp:Transcript_28143/g.65423  ORF Transcript_28143/g.65423 Transcript_28143/m.65423 type:complete len:210 (-) Transcript_28143:146-775(-)